MTAAPLFTPVLPPGTSPARPTQGEASSDVAGLFALLLAGPQPVELAVAPGAGPSTRPASALAAAPVGDFARAPAPPALGPQAQAALIVGCIGPAAPDTASTAPALPSALPAPAGTGSGPAGPMSQLTSADPAPGPAGPAVALSAGHALTAPPQSALGDPGSGPADASADVPAPLPSAIAIAPRPPAASVGTLQMANTPAAATETVSMAAPAAAKAPPTPDGWSLQTGAPPAVPDASPAEPRTPSSASVGDRSVAAPGRGVQQPHAPLLASGSGSPAPAPDQPADDQGWLEPDFETPARPIGQLEHAATEPARAPAAGRSAPPPPMFQVGVHIAKAVPARVERLFVQLEPASLGRVEVRLEFHRDHQLSAVIAAERPDTLDALQRDARVLERNLQQAGLRLDSDGLTFSLKREQAHDQPHEERPFASSADDLGDQPLLAAPHEHEPPRVQWFRGLRALDISV